MSQLEYLDRSVLVAPDAEGRAPFHSSVVLAADARPLSQEPAPALPLMRSYEDIDGMEGRGVFFRPHRYTGSELSPLGVRVVVALAGGRYDCELRDVSQSGVAFVWPTDLRVELCEELSIALLFDSHEAFRGRAVVRSIRHHSGCSVIGASFVASMLDVDEMLQLRAIRQWSSREVSRHVAAISPADDRFKAAVAELRLYLESGKQELGEFEDTLPRNVLHGPGSAIRHELVSGLRETFVADVVRLSEDIDVAVRAMPEAHACARAKHWSLRHVHDLFMVAPICHRARHKPRGLPGRLRRNGFHLRAEFRWCDAFCCRRGIGVHEHTSGDGRAYRKELVKESLSTLLHSSRATSRPIRILSIAAGPGQESVEFLNGLRDLTTSVEVVLLEQDKEALAHAWRRLGPHSERFPGKLHFTFLHDSIEKLLRDKAFFAPFGRFDFVYSCGLFDYLRDRTAVVLIRRLASLLAEGGRLLIANMTDHPTRWLMEHHLDWFLNYRTARGPDRESAEWRCPARSCVSSRR